MDEKPVLCAKCHAEMERGELCFMCGGTGNCVECNGYTSPDFDCPTCNGWEWCPRCEGFKYEYLCPSCGGTEGLHAPPEAECEPSDWDLIEAHEQFWAEANAEGLTDAPAEP